MPNSDLLSKLAKLGHMRRSPQGLKLSVAQSELDNDFSSASDASSSNVIYSRPTISVPIKIEMKPDMSQVDAPRSQQQEPSGHR